jgi:hypothetical protein
VSGKFIYPLGDGGSLLSLSVAHTHRSNYLLAQAHVDAPSLTNSIAALNASTTFSPLQPLLDTDVAGYLRHAHEQTLISTIEEGRRETETEFYHVLEERVRRDWETRKKRIFEELSGRGFATETSRPTSELRQSTRDSINVPVCYKYVGRCLNDSFFRSSWPHRLLHLAFRCTRK